MCDEVPSLVGSTLGNRGLRPNGYGCLLGTLFMTLAYSVDEALTVGLSSCLSVSSLGLVGRLDIVLTF